MRPRPHQPRATARLIEKLKICLSVAILAVGIPYGSLAAPTDPGFIQFSVQDREDSFIPIGEVEFCLNSAGNTDACLYADIEQGFPGHFALDAEDLIPGATYTVMIYTMDVQVIYEIRDWVYVAEDYDRGWDKLLNCDKFLVYPQFHGDPDGRLSFEIATTLNPVWEERAGEGFVIAEADPLKFPDVIISAQITNMLGDRFKSDTDAAGGVLSVSAGWQLTGIWRHGYPQRHRWDEGWVNCRELSVTYAQNRYETQSIMAPGRVGDVTFHRVNLAYGVARMNQAQINHYGIAAVLSVGGIFDGGDKLTYLERKYSLFGAGLQAHYRKMFLSGGGLEVGGVLEAGAVYYPADTHDDDFWFGLAPTISLGVVVF